MQVINQAERRCHGGSARDKPSIQTDAQTRNRTRAFHIAGKNFPTERYQDDTTLWGHTSRQTPFFMLEYFLQKGMITALKNNNTEHHSMRTCLLQEG